MSLAKRTGSNITWILLSDLFGKGSMVFATVYLARVLGVEHFGIFSLGIAIANSVWPLVDLGTNGYGTREVARDSKNAGPLLSSLGSLRFFASFVMIFIGIAVLEAMAVETIKSYAIIGALLYLTCYAICPDWVVRGLEQMRWLFVINLLTAIFFVVGIVVYVDGAEDLVEASVFRSLSYGIGSIAGLILLYTKRSIFFSLKVTIERWIDLIKRTYFFLFIRMATNLGQYISLFVVTYVLTEADTGLYAAPHRLYIIAISLLAAITAAVYPILSKLHHSDTQADQFSRYQRQLVQFFLMIFMPAAGLGLVCSDSIIDFIFGVEYAASADTLMILLITLPFVAMRSIFMFTMMAGGAEKKTYPLVLCSVMVQAISAAILAPTYGLEGAAVSMLAGEIVACGLLIYNSVRLVGVKSPFDSQFLALLVIVSVMVLLALFLELQIIGVVVIGVPTYLVLLVLFKQLSISDIKGLMASRT